MKLFILTIFEFQGIKYIHTVQLLSSVSRILFIMQNWNSLPIKQWFHITPNTVAAPGNHDSTLCLFEFD